MALTNTNIDPTTGSTPGHADPMPATSSLLVSLASLPAEALEATLTNLALAFRNRPETQSILVATPDATHPIAASPSFGDLRLVSYVPSTPISISHFLTAPDFLNTFRIAEEHNATACLILGAESSTLTPEAIRTLGNAALSSTCDLVVPRYQIGPNEGLVNSAILYPTTRALFGARSRFPLAIDFGLSLRMAERLANAAQRFISADQNEAILWPVAEAAIGNCTITEVDGGTRSMPQPASPDINALLAQIAGSLFVDVDAKATFWQRTRPAHPIRLQPQDHPVRQTLPDGWPDVTPMLEAFRLAYSNLSDIWSLILPPNSLLGLKRLSVMPPASFRMPDALWARIVFDFILAYRLRTINRGHLLGALAPLYLAWVASHITLAETGITPESHIEAQAAAFEYDKPYLVSRWRWPDRFNP